MKTDEQYQKALMMLVIVALSTIFWISMAFWAGLL